MKKKIMKKSMCGRKGNSVQEFDKKPEKKSTMPKEYRARIGSGI